MRAILDRSPELCRWVAARIPHMHGRGFGDSATAIGIEDNAGRLLGAVVFHDWNPENGTIQGSGAAASPRWALAREAWATIFAYAFDTCRCHKFWCAVPRDADRTIRFLRGQGFVPEAILRHHLGIGRDAVILSRFNGKKLVTRPPNPARNTTTKARPDGKARSSEAPLP